MTLSTMSPDDLMVFWGRYHRPTRKAAEDLVGDRRPGFTTIAACVASYACNLAVALQCAGRGDAHGESVYRHCAKVSFERVPADVREAVGMVPPC